MKLAAVVVWCAAAVSAWAQTATMRTAVEGLRSPNSLALDAAENLHIGSWFGPIWRLTTAGDLETVVESAPAGAFLTGIAVDGEGRIYAADWSGDRIWRYDGEWSVVMDADLNAPDAIAVDNAGNLYVADTGNRRVRIVRTDGSVRTVVDGVKAVGLAVDTTGNVYAVDYPSAIRKIAADGTISTLAVSTEAAVPMSVAVGRDGTAYFGELGRVRAAGAEGPRTVVEEVGFTPQGIVVDGRGVLWVADVVNGRVRRIEFHD